MHEMGLAKDVLRNILEAGKNLKKITSADVNIGETLITDKEEFFELFGQVSKGTSAEGVKLKVTIIPLMAFCKKCNNDFTAKQIKSGCPKCNSNDFKIVSGREIVIKEIK